MSFNVSNPSGMMDKVISWLIFAAIAVVALPLLFTSFTNISNISGLPFASFWAAGGVIVLLVGVALLRMGIKGFSGGKR